MTNEGIWGILEPTWIFAENEQQNVYTEHRRSFILIDDAFHPNIYGSTSGILEPHAANES